MCLWFHICKKPFSLDPAQLTERPRGEFNPIIIRHVSFFFLKKKKTKKKKNKKKKTIMCRCEYLWGKIFVDVKNLYRFSKKNYNCQAVGGILKIFPTL